MTLTPSWPGVSGAATTTHVRKALSGLFATSAAGVPRTGILSGATALVTARSDMNVDVQPFTGVASQFGGAIIFANDGVIQLDASLISPTAGTNFYVVYVKQNEHTSPGTDANDAQVASAALSTVDFATARAALPPGALELATVQMPAGKASTNASGVTILPSYAYTAMSGGVVPVRDGNELAAWTPPPGDFAFRIDMGTTFQRTATDWAPVAGVLPQIDVVAGAQINVPSGGSANVNLWSTPGSGQSVVRPGGSEWFTYNPTTGDITCVKAGRYQVMARLAVQPASSGAAQAYLIRGGSPTDVLTLDSVNAHSSQQTMLKLDVDSVVLAAGASLRVWISSVTAALTVGGSNRTQGEFSIRYLGPS